ncbi:uracil-DNA glycosylase family protein [Gillisia sp. Hel_I_29]|uniref:uracil-DNA glycosylase family protein n=1 Tax=Gillisia sp. Hel_I_29 TaxID=1249975 RepID=UPI000550C6BD|nr:uracil-DNA glycosylase family protein [Gillisia sp. Hel_I_29]
MNSELTKLYSSKWTKFYEELSKINTDSKFPIKPANPLLLKIGDVEKYRNSDIKVMFCGQEPNTWGGELKNSISKIQLYYQDFFLSNYCYDKYGGQFWNGVNRLRELIYNKFPGKSIDFIWNDIVKVGKRDGLGLPPRYIEEVELKYFKVIREEVEILKPDVIIFMSGPNYDWFIKQQFGEVNFISVDKFTERQIVKIDIPGVSSAYRTYHPNYLWRNNIDHYFNSILEEITLDINSD